MAQWVKCLTGETNDPENLYKPDASAIQHSHSEMEDADKELSGKLMGQLTLGMQREK